MLITPAYAQAAAGANTTAMLMSRAAVRADLRFMYFLILSPAAEKVKSAADC